MKQAVILFVIIIVAVTLYTLFGIVTFEEDKPQPFVFDNPVYPAGISNADPSSSLTPEQIEQQRLSDEAIDEALATFRGMRNAIPQQALETLDIITSQADSGLVPIYFLSGVDPATGKRSFETMKLDPTRWAGIVGSKSSVFCSIQNPPADILVGSEENNTLECNTQNSKPSQFNRMFLGGPGNDTITDTNGNRLVNGGTGDDTIALGAGRSIIVLDSGWGHDQVTADCTDTAVTPDQMPVGFPVKYPYKTTNFIILSPRLSPKDVKWEGNVLKSLTSDDTLTVNERCFTVVPEQR